LFTAWHCICSREGIIYVPWLRRKMISTASQVPLQPSSFHILPISFLPVGRRREMLRSGWSGSSEPSALPKSLLGAPAKRPRARGWAALCPPEPPALPSSSLVVAPCPPAEGQRIYPDPCKTLSRNGLLAAWERMVFVIPLGLDASTSDA